MEKFCITYTENGTEFDVIWKGKDAPDAVKTFWESFDYDDRNNVGNVKIYAFVEVAGIDTSENVLYKQENETCQDKTHNT